MRTWNLILAAALLAASPAFSSPPTDAQKCESSFELASAKYAHCRLTAESKFTRIENSTKLSEALGRCWVRLSDALVRAVTKYGGPNCTAETPAAFETYLTRCSNDAAAAAAINGTLPDYVGDLAACSGDLSTCNADLSTCNGDLATCTADLATATADLATCEGDLAACEALLLARLLKTGQTTPYGAGTDGDLELGIAQGYVDNGDGTITDTRTGLMWEKKSDDGTIHDKDNGYTWAGASYGSTNVLDGTAATTFLATLNAGGGFAGHTDWRLPNLTELESIRNLQNENPAVSAAFNTNCGASSSGNPGCTVTACSCTVPSYYWSSSTKVGLPQGAWGVVYNDGNVYAYSKGSVSYYVRAVRAVRAVRGGP